MRKRELVHLHALLDRVATYLATEGVLTDADIETYSELAVAPTAVYRSKSDHELAVRTLSTALVAAIADESTVELSGDHTTTPMSPPSF